jgi:hypothetical protein
MTKANRTLKPSKPKASAKKGKRRVDPILDLLKNMDEDLLAMLQRTMQAELAFGSETQDSEDPVAHFAEYLESCTRGEFAEAVKTDLLVDLVEELSELKLDSNGGDRAAREKIQAIYDLLDDAIERRSLHPIDLILTGKILADAGWAVPDSLRRAMSEALDAAPLDSQGVTEDSRISWLSEITEQAGHDPFDIHDYLSSLFAGFPPEASIKLLSGLIAAGSAVIDQAVAGFVLSPDAGLARSVADALAASAAQRPVESSLIERLVRMRPWLPQTRQTHLDATIRAMRLNALPPVVTQPPKVIKCYASACDGSGANGLFVTQKVGSSYQVATIMTKITGIVDAIVFPDLSKSAMDDIVRQMKSAMLTTETDLAGVGHIFELAIAENLASGNPPPFKLEQVVESLGLGPVHPDPASPLEIITSLLADLPPEQINAAAVARAHADILESEFKYQWFEAGEALEDLLYPVKGFRRRVAKLMKVYLPERRAFWARQCAISVLAMRGVGQRGRSLWKQLALVGRTIASDAPLDQIPLMKQIAEISVQVFEGGG